MERPVCCSNCGRQTETDSWQGKEVVLCLECEKALEGDVSRGELRVPQEGREAEDVPQEA